MNDKKIELEGNLGFLKEDDVVMCTVKRIEGTTVFLEIEGSGNATMTMSEVAAGRIRNIREYVYPNKKVVCKVLKASNAHIELSLRRVTAKERDLVQENYKKEKTFTSILKSSLKNSQEIIDKIKQKYELWDFFDKVKENSSLLAQFTSSEEASAIAKLLAEKREKDKEVKRVFILKSYSDAGIKDMREILSLKNSLEVKYLGSSRFSISCSAKDFKEAEMQVNKALIAIESKAKEKKAEFELIEKP